MSHVKAGGSCSNIHNNAGQRLGVKRYGGQKVNAGEIIVRQTGSTKIAGPGTFVAKNYSIHAAVSGVVKFEKVKKKHFTGKTVPRTQISVVSQ